MSKEPNTIGELTQYIDGRFNVIEERIQGINNTVTEQIKGIKKVTWWVAGISGTVVSVIIISIVKLVLGI